LNQTATISCPKRSPDCNILSADPNDPAAPALPIVRIEASQKAHRGVHLADLADYIDKRRAAASICSLRKAESDQLAF
jgi:Pyocin activator protein PrtN